MNIEKKEKLKIDKLKSKTIKCKECGHKPDGIHLGKSSAEWQFCFQHNGRKYYKNVKEMKEWLKDKQIENEYGEIITSKDFWKMIEEEQRILVAPHNKVKRQILKIFYEYKKN